MRLHPLFFTLVLALNTAPSLAEQIKEDGADSTVAETLAPGVDETSAESPPGDEEAQYLAWARGIWESLDRQQGTIQLANGIATLEVPEGFYYLNPADAEKVLVDVWGNPPGQETLGMLFSSDLTPFDDGAWAVTVDYEEEGYVSDEDADEIDYNEMLASMQEDARLASEDRVKNGYEAIELVGWAAPPYYDKTSHKLHWAKELKFGDGTEGNTLNYNIRVLGRKGVLVLNFIAGIEQKALIDQQLHRVLAMAEFNDGSRYSDFNPELDKVAAYGLGALVAGKVVVKTGLLAAALIFLKKFGVLIVVGVGALFGKLFKRKEKGTESA